MPWYYKEGTQEIGPVEKEELQNLINTKRINGQTLVRPAGKQEWKPLSQLVRPKQPRPSEEQHAGQEAPEAPLTMERDRAPRPAPTPTPTPAPPTTVCSQCGRSFPRDQVLEYQGKAICGACKPMFVQRMREGVGSAAVLNYAGFWIRFVAKFIDGIILGVVQWILVIPASLMTGASMPQASGEMPSSGFFMIMGVQQLIGILIPACYNTFFIGKFKATPGKMACRLQVVQPDSGQVSYMRALGRNFAEWLSAMILAIGYIMAAFDSEKRALHDRVCSTRVVKK